MAVVPGKVLLALPITMRKQVDFIAQCEHRTRSDLIREALRRYIAQFQRVNSSATLPEQFALLTGDE